ncbi:hypothetical protein DFH28DRAFT_927169 [Melampsora americana]|nr:hypothetical protein DFH28DRAFT_927169 [Melampsora americana]
MPSKSACPKEELSSQSYINDPYSGRTPSSYSTNNATSPASGMTPSGMVNKKDNQSSECDGSDDDVEAGKDQPQPGPTHLLGLEHHWWYELAARACAKAFARAQSNQYVAMLLELFQEDLFQQWSTKESETIRRMYKHASSLQASHLLSL